MEQIKRKKPAPITVKGIGKRGKNPHVNFNPGVQTNHFKEAVLAESPVKVKARSAKTGRTITRRFKSPEEAAKHYHKWLTSRRLRNVQLTSEQALMDKASDYELPFDMIQEVYNRSIDSWIPESNSTQEQWAFAGVNSFLEGGRAFDLNEDLITEAVYRITAKTSNKSLGKLSSRRDSLGKQAKAELERRKKAEKSKVYGSKSVASKKLQNALVGQSTITPAVAAKIIATLKINPKTAVAKSLNKVAKKHVEKKKIAKIIGKTLQSKEAQAIERATNKALKQKLEAKALKKSSAEKEARKQEREAAKVKLAKKEERLKNQRLTAKAAAHREREDAKAKADADRIANLVKDALAKAKAANNAESVKDSASENFRKSINPDVAKPTPKGSVLDTVKKFFGKKSPKPEPEDNYVRPAVFRNQKTVDVFSKKHEDHFIKRMESPLTRGKSVRELDLYRHLKNKQNPKPFNPEN